MSRAGDQHAGELGRGQFGLLVDHRTGRYLGAVVVKRGDKVLEFNPGDAQAIFQPGDLPLGTGGNLEEARTNAEKTIFQEKERQIPDGGGRKYVDSYGGEDRFLLTDEDWEKLLALAKKDFPVWATQVLRCAYDNRKRGKPVSRQELAEAVGQDHIGNKLESINNLLRPYRLSLRIASSDNHAIHPKGFYLYFIPRPKLRGKQNQGEEFEPAPTPGE